MTPDKIKAAIDNKGYTIKEFSEILGVSYDNLRKVLSGNKPLTKQLSRHIMLALQIQPYNPNWRAVSPVGQESGFALPPRIWYAIEEEATARGITTAEYVQNLIIGLAKKIAEHIILYRPD